MQKTSPRAMTSTPGCVCGATRDAHDGGHWPNGCDGYRANRRLVRQLQDEALQNARQRLQEMRATPATLVQISHATGVPRETLGNVARGEGKSLTQAVYDAIMNTTIADVPAQAEAPAELVIYPAVVTRALCALGWSMEWQAVQYGQSLEWVRDFCAGEIQELDGYTLVAIHETAARVDSAPLRGQSSWGPDLECALDAHEKGWFPLACYDDNGTLLHGAIRDDLKQVAIEQTLMAAQERRYVAAELPSDVERYGRQIQVVRLTLRGHNAEEIAGLLNISGRTVVRYRREFGLQFLSGKKPLDPAHAELAQAMREIIALYDISPQADTYAVVRALEALTDNHAATLAA
jgi:hypothetical protein